MYRLYFEDLNLKRRYFYINDILDKIRKFTCWSGTLFDFCQYRWPAAPGEDPCSCSSGTLLDPGDDNYPASSLIVTFYNLIVSFGDPVKILGPPPVREL